MRRRIVPELLRVGRRLRASLFRPSVEREVAEELEFHVAMRTRELVERGVDEDEARRRAEALFRDMDDVRRRCERIATQREGTRMWKGRWDDVRQDLVFTLRQLRRKPVFAAVTILTLALGIGANTAVFSVVYGVLLRPLPYEEPGELVSLWTRYLPSTGLDIPQFPLSHPELRDYRNASEAMEEVAAYSLTRATVDDGTADPERVRVLAAGRRLTSLLGVRPALGRDFSPEEHDPGAAPAILLSHRYWTERFGADPDVVGRSLEMDGRTSRIVGVLPAGRDFPSAAVDLWTPLGLDEADPGNRGAHWLSAVGRLAPGVPLTSAEAELESITAAWYEEWEHHGSGHFIFLRPLKEDLVGSTRQALLALMAAVGLVLVIACVNVANLFLVRSESREAEMAVRTALGAGRARLIRLLLTEALLVSALGAALGVAVAWWATPLLLALDPGAVPRTEEIGVGLPVLAFTAAVTVGTTLALGLVPAFGARRRGGWSGSPGRASAGRRAGRGRRLLIAGQVALCTVVLVGAGLVARSFRTLTRVDPGVETASVMTFGLALPGTRYPDPEEVAGTWAGLLDRLRALPGVAAAGAVNALPLTDAVQRSDFVVEGEPEPAPGVPTWNAQLRAFTPGYFEALDIRVLEGEPPSVGAGAEDPLVVWVDRALAERYWPGESAVGKRIAFRTTEEGEPLWLSVAGVVDAVRSRLDRESEPHVYLPHRQLAASGMGTGRNMSVALRTSVPPSGLAPGIRAAVREIDPGLPVIDLRTMEQIRDRSVGRARLSANLMGGFGLLALLLAALGIHGVVSWSVARRTREVGIRSALGAGRPALVGMMLAEGTLPALAGLGVGVGMALLLAPFLGDVLFQVRPRDPATFILLSAGLMAVALLSAWLPARKAARIHPSEALRTE